MARKSAEPKRIWDNYRDIGEVRKTDGLKIVVSLAARDGVKYVVLREWYLKKSEGIWKPSLDKVRIPIAVPIEGSVKQPLSGLTSALAEAMELSKEFELEGEAVWMQPKD